MSGVPEYAKIRQLPPHELAELLRTFLPPRPHPEKCGLGSCAPHIALDALLEQAANGEDAQATKGTGN